jgi:ATP/maltotriose-dependent transcriptional regulator MalT
LERLARGQSNKEIARAIGVSPSTVKTHVANIYAKLGVAGRGKAVDAARALALIP